MSEEIEVLEEEVAPERKLSPMELAIASARNKLSRYVPRAVELLTELAETSENDRVRLAAVDSILDRAGLGKQTSVQVENGTSGEHEAARREAEEMIASLQRNKNEQAHKDISLDALIVHEGDDEEVLTVAST